jgi:hypothetical protein
MRNGAAPLIRHNSYLTTLPRAQLRVTPGYGWLLWNGADAQTSSAGAEL